MRALTHDLPCRRFIRTIAHVQCAALGFAVEHTDQERVTRTFAPLHTLPRAGRKRLLTCTLARAATLLPHVVPFAVARAVAGWSTHRIFVWILAVEPDGVVGTLAARDALLRAYGDRFVAG